MRGNRTLIIRLALLAVGIAFVAGFAIDQYGTVRDIVRFLCLSCLGLGG